jgi:hypothetical protein
MQWTAHSMDAQIPSLSGDSVRDLKVLTIDLSAHSHAQR